MKFAPALLLAALLCVPACARPVHSAKPAPWIGETRGLVALYSEPSTAAPMIDVYKKDTLVLVDGVSHGFGHVVFSETTQGWMPLKAIRRMTAAQVQAYVKHYRKAHPDVDQGGAGGP